MKLFVTNFIRLQSFPGLGGICAAKGSRVVMNHLPFSDIATVTLLKTVDSILNGYEEVGRNVNRLVFGFDKGVVLIAVRDVRRMIAWADGARADLDQIMLAMEGFLESHPQFEVQRPMMKKDLADPGMPPGSTIDQWGRRVVSLRGMTEKALDKDDDRPLPPPPDWRKSDSDAE